MPPVGFEPMPDRKNPHGRRRPDPIAGVWDSEIVSLLEATPLPSILTAMPLVASTQGAKVRITSYWEARREFVEGS